YQKGLWLSDVSRNRSRAVSHTWRSSSTRYNPQILLSNPLISVNYENFSKLLEPFEEFSPAFFERARDASLCWKAQAYFACCAMCGAAAEAVLLSIASAKLGNAEAARMYDSRNGRSRIENVVMGQARDFIRQNLQPLFGLISYWRDQSSHGSASGVGRDEALTALRSLFYYAKLAHEHWSELSGV
ncbi:MAG: hypothetical protein ACYC60_22750, partial [Thermoanaerobaculia bacterium]